MTEEAKSAPGWMVKDFADGWIYCPTYEAARAEAEGAGNRIVELSDFFRIYRAERQRLLSNARCMHGLAKRFADITDVRGYLIARNADRRALAALRANWKPFRAAVASVDTKATHP